MKLTKMTEYVLEQYEKIQDSIIFEENCFMYANLLKQPLKLWMFVPCKLVDGVWVVLEQPKFHYTEQALKQLKGFELDIAEEVNFSIKEYQQAKELILFEGFEIDYDNIIQSNNIRLWFKSESDIYIHNTRNKVFAIEDLVKYNLELTPAAKKQFNI